VGKTTDPFAEHDAGFVRVNQDGEPSSGSRNGYQNIVDQLSKQLSDAVSIANGLAQHGKFHALRQRQVAKLMEEGWKLYASPGEVFLYRSVQSFAFELPVARLAFAEMKRTNTIECDGTTWGRRDACGFRLVSS
jgi:hypothetical protein